MFPLAKSNPTMSLYALGEGSIFFLPPLPGIQWVVTKHDHRKVEFMGDAYGQALYAIAEKAIARNVQVCPKSTVDPADHKALGGALTTMKGDHRYVELQSLSVGTRALIHCPGIQAFRKIRIEKQALPCVWVSVYDDDGTKLGTDLLIGTHKGLKLD